MTIELEGRDVAVVGYGSLLSVPSLEVALKRRYEGPFQECGVAGWRRSWDVAMPNKTFYIESDKGSQYPDSILYLNVKPEPGTVLTAIVFVLSPAELEAMDLREWIYDRIAVNDALRGVMVQGGPAYLYVGKPEFTVRDISDPMRAAVRRTYLSILKEGMKNLDAEFRDAYEATTDPVPQRLVVDDIRDPEAPNPFRGPH